jgi:hypothetical protein
VTNSKQPPAVKTVAQRLSWLTTLIDVWQAGENNLSDRAFIRDRVNDLRRLEAELVSKESSE